MNRLITLIIPFIFGCTFSTAQVPTAFPTATTVQSDTLPPTAARTVSVINTATSTDTPTETTAPTRVALKMTPVLTKTPTTEQATEGITPTATLDGCPPSDANSAQHQAEATIDYESKTVQVKQTITYTNQTGETLDRLVLNVEPNRWLEAFTLNGVTIGDVRARAMYTLTGRRMDILPVQPIEPNCTYTVHLDFTLTVPPIIGGVEAFRGYFGHTSRQINLGHWLPTVVPYRGGEWLYHESIFIGEQIVLDWADWYVTVNLINAPDGALVAAPGSITELDPTSWRFYHTNAREFAVSVSHVFTVTEQTTDAGTQVQVYTLPDAVKWVEETQQWLGGGEYAAKITAESVDLFADKFGAYPHERLLIVQGDFPDGMEFSGFSFVSTDWFVGYEGSPQSYLMLITVHEVAHSWWYDLVGNDQAYNPWLDESLATYSEYIYIEAYYPDMKDWWWWFRVNRLNPEGYVNSSVYEFQAIRPYINAVYLRGVLMLHDMRTALGDEAFYQWLTDYANANAGQIATADDLWAQLTDEQLAATVVIRTAFLREPGVQPVIVEQSQQGNGNQNRHEQGN